MRMNPGRRSHLFYRFSFALCLLLSSFSIKGLSEPVKMFATADGLAHDNLRSGSYSPLMRAVNAEVKSSRGRASILFDIPQPFWRRWWFLTLAALFIAILIVVVERSRAQRLKELNKALAQSEKLAGELKKQRAELKAANRALELEFVINHIIAEAVSLAEAAPLILRAVCASTDWEIGMLWRSDTEAGLLRCVAAWHQPHMAAGQFEAQTLGFVFAHGEGLPGRVWQSAGPLWIEDLSRDTNFPRHSIAASERVRSGVGVPILASQRVLGVMEFFSREKRELDKELLRMIANIGTQTGQLMERKLAEEAIRESEDRFRTLAETASDAIITIDQSSTILFVNAAAGAIFGHSIEEMIGADLTMLMPEYLRHLHRAGLQRYAETGKRHTSWEAIELPGLHRNGQEIPLEISFGEFKRDGKRYFTGIARDITERKRAEDELRQSREERLRELERVRKRIATDLHDDIGSSLTQISILSEVARRQIGPDDNPITQPLSMIAHASRELVDSMSDIVWAINPQKDHLSDLSQRMRRFASDTLTACNIEFGFRAPETEEDVALGANLRREFFLIFKEGVNNMVKHSACTKANIEFCVMHDHLTLEMSDNGKGFDTASESDGHGLMSMRERGKSLGAELAVVSSKGSGTIITLKVPFDQHHPAMAAQKSPLPE